jgi:hypothetical protein
MPEFEIYECAQCGETFGAHPSAPAAKNRYCSPACEATSKGLA